jgi:8-amino-7-oxononanoate synthase
MNDPRFDYLAEKTESLRSFDSLRTLHPYFHDGMMLVSKDGQRLINFGSNDYLGMAASVEVKYPAGVKHEGLSVGAGASALVTGYTTLHEALCHALANLEETEAATLFPSGFAACCGTVATLAEEGDLLLSDSLNHASLIDGCRLSKATKFIYPHRDVEFVTATLAQHRHRFARAWIVTDGVFGMDGDVAPLNELCDVADRFDANLIVDEAHATGVLGHDGSGSCSELGVKSRVAIRIGTLSKAIGSHGGFVAGPQVVIDYLVNRCRTLIFSTAGSPLTIAAAIQGVEAIRWQPALRDRVRASAREFRERIGSALPTAMVSTTVADVPIIPVVVGSNESALNLARSLRESGFFVPAIRPPTVPEGTARLRISVSAAHQPDDLERLAQAILDLNRGL